MATRSWGLFLLMGMQLGVVARAAVTQASEPQRPVPAASAAAATAASPASPRPATPAIDILEIDVEGNTLLAQTDIESAVYPHLGPGKSVKDVEAARRDLEKRYHDHGFLTVLVNIPPQKIVGGLVHLKVVEAPIGKLTILGSRYHSLETMRETVPALAQGNVPNFNEVQKELGALNRGADRRVTPVLRASQTPGQVDVELQVKDELPLHANADFNDHYSANTSHLRTGAEVHYDNLFQRGQSIDLQYQTAPQDVGQVQVWSLSYVIPTGGSAVWAAYAVHSASNVAAVGTLSVIGNGDIYGLRFIEPLGGGTPRFYHSVSAGFDYKKFKQDVFLQGGDNSVSTPIHYMPFTVQYSANWLGEPPAGASDRTPVASTGLNLGVTFAIRGFATHNADFDAKRFGASPSFAIFHPSLQRLQPLPAAFSLFARVDGQLASGPLISNEQFSAGGFESVRGYVESERLGDQGWHGSLELRTPALFFRNDAKVEQSYAFVFVDGARVQTNEALPGSQSRYALGSYGLGVQFKGHGLNVHVDGAHTMANGFVTGKDTNRGVFEVNYGF